MSFFFLKNLPNKAFHFWFLISRPMTLGVRVIVHDTQRNSVFLIQHTYIAGWHLPGGGVEVGETMVEAAIRELKEETNIETDFPLELKSIYYNNRNSKRDHIGLYFINQYSQISPKQPNSEIADGAFFSLDALPQETSSSTLQRLREVFNGANISSYW